MMSSSIRMIERRAIASPAGGLVMVLCVWAVAWPWLARRRRLQRPPDRCPGQAWPGSEGRRSAQVAEDRDQLGLAHRGTTLDVELGRKLLQLLDGPLRVGPGPDLAVDGSWGRLGLRLAGLGAALRSGLAGPGRCLGGRAMRGLRSWDGAVLPATIVAACSAASTAPSAARPTLVPAAFTRLRAVLVRWTASRVASLVRMAPTSPRPRRARSSNSRPASPGRPRLVATPWTRSWWTLATPRSRAPRSRFGDCLTTTRAWHGPPDAADRSSGRSRRSRHPGRWSHTPSRR